VTDVERAIDDDVEGKTAARPKFEQTDPALDAVTRGHQTDACDLFEPADAAKQLRAIDRGTE
jgi:hypothetical protein